MVSQPSPMWPRRAVRTSTPITEEAIVEVALGLLDEEGIDAVTMRAVAERLNVTTPTVYWHVVSKESMFDRVFDRLCGEVELPAGTQGWDNRLREVAQGMRAVFAAHNDAARLAIGRFPMGPKGLAVTEVVLAALRESGVTDDEVAFSAFGFFSYVVAFCHQEKIAPLAGGGSDRTEALARIRSYLEQLPAAQFPQLNYYAQSLTSGGLDRRFAFGLNQFIGGLKSVSSKG
jgi:AcrR family transcriptional regulator